MSKVVKAVAGIAIAAVGFATGNPFLVLQGLSLTASSIFSPKAANQEERQASETTLQMGEVPRQAGLGTFATAGSLLDAFNYGGKYGTDWEVQQIALVDHECEELVGFYVNDEYVAFGGDGDVAGYNSQLKVHFLPGTATQAWPSHVTANGPGWDDPDNNCKGVACVAVAYKADDPEVQNPVWSGGRPRFIFVLKGKKLYDPAKDSTVTGGSGTHRWADPSTWEWSDNANVCRYNFQRGIFALDQVDQPEQLLIGRGLSEIEAPPERSIAHSATCDELVDGEKRYTFNGLIGADEEFLTVEGYFAAAMAGIIRQPEGSIEVEPGQAKAVVAEITDLDILNLAEVQYEAFRGEGDREWINSVIPRYVEPDQKWKMHTASIRRDYADIIADGGQRVETLELKQVTVEGQAERCAEITRKLGRLQGKGGLSLGPRFCELEEGDWIGWTSARHFGGARKVFRIESYQRDGKWHIRIDLREIAASVYAFDPASDSNPNTATATQQAAPPAIDAPGAAAWSLLGGQVSGPRGDQPALFLSGASDDSLAQAIRVEQRVSGTTPWIHGGDFPPAMTEKAITGVADETAYEVAVSYVVSGEPGARRVLGPVTTGVMEGARGARWIASKSLAYPLTSDDDSIAVAAFTGTLYDGSQVSFPADTDDMTSLASGTNFGVFYDPLAGTYSAHESPAETQMADRSLIFIGGQSTSDSGVYDDPPTPPGGSGGGGNYNTP
ncbi:phage tail protein [Qipengyuania sp.]|uniref:phage tail protein n=1 Tax=Qipengyuania sp. TaxID=2004515 RepID=UPI0035144451